MLRTTILRPRWLTTVLVLWVSAWVSLPVPAGGAPLPPARSAGSPAGMGGDGVAPIETEVLQQALVRHGLSPADAAGLLARLTVEERAELAQRAGEVAVGGDGTLLIIALILVVAILLYLPMAGRMQGWW